MIERQKQWLEAIIESASDLIMTIDHNGKIQSSNQAIQKMLGFDPGEVVGKSFGFLIAEPYREEFDQNIEQFLQGKPSQLIGSGRRIEARMKNEKLIPVSVTFNEVRLGDERLLSAVIRDITQILNTERELEIKTRELARSNTELEQFAAVAAHDLQAPLRNITNLAGLVKRRYNDQIESGGADYLDRIEKSALRMQSLVTDLLSLSRLGKKEKKLKPTDSNAVFDELLKDIALTVSETGARISRGDLPIVLADAGLLHQLFQNLILNAVKFRRPEVTAEVKVSAEADGAFWKFCIQDNGIGIEEKYFERIFEIFQRLHGKSEYPGSGIGLAICQKIVELHEGKLWVESEAGKGSHFYFLLRKVSD